MSRVVSTVTGIGMRVRLEGCPGCGRPLVLDHASMIGAGGAEVPDVHAVDRAQRLHLASCAP